MTDNRIVVYVPLEAYHPCNAPNFYRPSLLCSLFGHKLDPVIRPVGSDYGKWRDQHGNSIAYFMRLCTRCGKRVPINDEHAVEKEKSRQRVAAAMNNARHQYGLSPLRWDT